ncbi:hypothetical protein B0H10DRAFT_986511 [Mycena sp. CBHHK59/15]|nr:hypothetical protein B0H10DRAFT_986511 [Mycena sp. CBHHK59/15]
MIPITADCTTFASLMISGVLSGTPNFPAINNGYYNVPVGSILTWEYQGCGFAFFNDVGSTYNICALDLARSVNAMAAFCTTVDNIDGQFQNDPLKSLLYEFDPDSS